MRHLLKAAFGAAVILLASSAGTFEAKAQDLRGDARPSPLLHLAQFAPPTGESLDRIILDDSMTWVANVYVSGSLRNVTLESGSYRSGYWTATADYDYVNRIFRGRFPGHVSITFENGRVVCLEYQDNRGKCRNPY
jgi:hypothetical protein